MTLFDQKATPYFPKMVSLEDSSTPSHHRKGLRGLQQTQESQNPYDEAFNGVNQPVHDSILAPADPSRRDEILQVCFSSTLIVLFW